MHEEGGSGKLNQLQFNCSFVNLEKQLSTGCVGYPHSDGLDAAMRGLTTGSKCGIVIGRLSSNRSEIRQNDDFRKD